MAGSEKNRVSGPSLVMLGLALVFGLSQGCARSGSLHRDDAPSPGANQSVPFHSDTSQGADNVAALPSPAADPKQAASLPFYAGMSARTVPAGTLLTVQLENSLAATKVRVGDAFTGSLAAPLSADQDTVIERGAAVTGHVESEKTSGSHQGRGRGTGYFRLTLDSITVEGRQVPLQTSSLFARGTIQPSLGMAVQKGHRLTFRLTAPVQLRDPNSVTNHPSSDLSTE